MQGFWLLGLVLVYSLPSGAATPSELEDLNNFHLRIRQLESQFIQTKFLKELKLKLVSKGTVNYLQKAGGDNELVWQINDPAPVKVVLTKNKVQVSRGELINTYESESLQQILHLLAFNLRQLQETHEVELLGVKKVRLSPKNKDVPVKTATLEFNKDNLLGKIVLIERSNDEIEINFFNQKVIFKE